MLKKGLACSAFAFGFCILFSIKLANVSLIAFYTFCVSSYFLNKQTILPGAIRLLKYSTVLFLASIVISLISGSGFELVLKGLGRRATFILTPLAFVFLNKESISIVKKQALKGIVFGTLFSSIFIIINILHEYYLTRELFSINKDLFNYYHTNFYFTRVLDIHPSYYGMFVIIALSVIYFNKGSINISKGVNVFVVILSTITIMFLNARIILFLFLILNVVLLINYFYRKTRKLLHTIALTGVVFLVLGVALFYATRNTYAYQRVFKETLWELSKKANTNYNFKGKGDSRMARWGAAWNIIEKQPLLGYGVFNETKVLGDEFLRLSMESSYKMKYNAHNQFLGFIIEGGVLSGVALVVFFVVNFFMAFKRKDVLFFFFTFSVFSICLIENYLVRNAGIVFVSFFSSIYLFNCVNNES